jgi:hypothetical protein
MNLKYEYVITRSVKKKKKSNFVTAIFWRMQYSPSRHGICFRTTAGRSQFNMGQDYKCICNFVCVQQTQKLRYQILTQIYQNSEKLRLQAKNDKVAPVLNEAPHHDFSPSFLTSALDGVDWSASCSGRLTPLGKSPPVPV